MAGWNVQPNTGALPDGAVGSAYSVVFDNYIGSTPNYTAGQPYSFSLDSGSLPPGLTFNKPYGVYSGIGDPDTTVTLGGTPTTGGTFSFSILWTNGDIPRDQLSDYTIFIPAAPPTKKKRRRGGSFAFQNQICIPDNGNMQKKIPHQGYIFSYSHKDRNGNYCYIRTNQRG